MVGNTVLCMHLAWKKRKNKEFQEMLSKVVMQSQDILRATEGEVDILRLFLRRKCRETWLSYLGWFIFSFLWDCYNHDVFRPPVHPYNTNGVPVVTCEGQQSIKGHTHSSPTQFLHTLFPLRHFDNMPTLFKTARPGTESRLLFNGNYRIRATLCWLSDSVNSLCYLP